MSKTDIYMSNEPLITNLINGEKNKVDVFGVPFDATSTYRIGSRFAPNSIREAFQNIEIYSKRLKKDLENVSIRDLGNLAKVGDINEMNKMVEEVTKEVIQNNKIPAILGGDHSLTNGSIRGTNKPTLVVFDAHLDFRDEFEGLKLSHATFLRRLYEDDCISNIIHIGSRAATKEEWDFVNKNDIKIIDMEKIYNLESGLREFRDELTSSGEIYVSIDLDVLDPAFAPGVGNPEANGMSSREILEFIYCLQNSKLTGFDIVELIPAYDNGSTSTLAARLLAELICIADN
ncbi:MAG: agmatinase [Thaumarchaeota archaeon]|nr:agmatinase [Nitrososphaerota archaeon]|tara:strand:+ start:12155 stop:13021 length:867 start_codon:yes stop_codon:yes gene_type:complete